MNKANLVLLAMLIFIFSGTSAQNAKRFYKTGNEFSEAGKYSDAIEQYNSAIAIESDNSDYYLARGTIFQKTGDLDRAATDLEKALFFSPKNTDAMICLAEVFNQGRNFDKALKILNHVSALERRNTKVYPLKLISLMGLERYDQALSVSDSAIMVKETPVAYYYRGLIYRQLNNEPMAVKEFEKSISKDKTLAEPRLALAEVILTANPAGAMQQCNEVLKNNDHNTEAYLIRSKVFMKNLDYPAAINDLSKMILLEPDNPLFYLHRANCYQEFKQHINAISDYSKYISLKPDDPDGYFLRAKSYEESMNYEKAIDDYGRIASMPESDARAKKYLKDATARLYELNRENDPPRVELVSPVPGKENIIEIGGDKTSLLISGTIKDRSKLKSVVINNEQVSFTNRGSDYTFLTNLDLAGSDKVTISVNDDYDNNSQLSFQIVRTETDPPVLAITAPFTNEEGQVFIDTDVPNIAIQGKITDASRIKSIMVGDVTASYRRDDVNPEFTAIVDISNLSKITVNAEDIYGNRIEREYSLNRDNPLLSDGNLMGRTWVVFVENSSYETFASLDGPMKDVGTIQRALANYQIHNVIHKKDMKKTEMERFFNIELRDLVKKNQVKSLLVWYAGHGKFINDIGYWIPVDAKRDDEFTYFNINSLKAGLQGYSDVVIHTLVVSDACESGPGFYSAMRAVAEEPACDNTIVAGAKSAQVFSSAGYELAADNSRFTETFAMTLLNNRNACIPIESIVKSVMAAVSGDKGQTPKFGKIQGLDDMNGTFFFMTK